MTTIVRQYEVKNPKPYHERGKCRESMLCTEEVAKDLGISVRAVHMRLNRGTFPEPDLKTGKCGKLYWRRSVIQQFKTEMSHE